MKDQVTERALKIAYERFGWNQAKFAEKLGVEKQHVTNWLRRGMPATRHAPTAKLLEITVEELLSGNPPEAFGDRVAAARIAEPAVVGYGIQVSREAFLFAAEWEKLAEPMKSQISAMVHTLVGEQAREKKKGRKSSVLDVAKAVM